MSGRCVCLPGFGLTMGLTAAYLGLIVLIPVAALMAKASTAGLGGFCQAAFSPRALSAYRLTFAASLAAAAVNLAFGTLAAWVLARYSFPGRKILNSLVDLPFALPTAVAGITLTTLLSRNGPLGAWLEALGIAAAFTPLGVAVALTFIGLPFVIRTVGPVIEELDPQLEEAAASLGAGRFRIFRSVVFPQLFPAALTGFAMAFARGLGEYGSVVFISGNMPMRTEIAAVLIVSKLEQFDVPAACAVAAVTLSASFALLLAINRLQPKERR